MEVFVVRHSWKLNHSEGDIISSVWDNKVDAENEMERIGKCCLEELKSVYPIEDICEEECDGYSMTYDVNNFKYWQEVKIESHTLNKIF